MMQFFTIVLFSLPAVALAQGFTPIVPLPFPVTDSTSIGQYLDGLFKLTISLGAALAVGSIVMGGFQYVASEALGDKAKGRTRIQNAVVGLILLLSVFLILNVINPQILKLDIFGKSGNSSIPGVPGSGGATGPLSFPSGSLPGSSAGGQAIQDITNQGTPDVNIDQGSGANSGGSGGTQSASGGPTPDVIHSAGALSLLTGNRIGNMLFGFKQVETCPNTATLQGKQYGLIAGTQKSLYTRKDGRLSCTEVSITTTAGCCGEYVRK